MTLPVRAGAAVGDDRRRRPRARPAPPRTGRRPARRTAPTPVATARASRRRSGSTSSARGPGSARSRRSHSSSRAGCVRERAHEVASAQLERVDAQLARRLVDRRSRKYPASGRPAPRHGPTGTLSVRAPVTVTLGGGDRVAAAHQHRGRVRRRRAVDVQVRAEVGDDPRAHGEHAPVGVERELDLGLHSAALVGGEEVLEPVLDPLDRAAEPQRRRGRPPPPRARAALGAERAADVGQRTRIARVERARGRARARAVGVLRRDPRGQPVAVRLGEDAARLDRRRDDARDRVLRAHDVRRGGERAVDVTARALEPQQLSGAARGSTTASSGSYSTSTSSAASSAARATRRARARPAGRRSAPRPRRAAGAGRRRSRPPAAPAPAAAREVGGRDGGHARGRRDAEDPRPRERAAHERRVQQASVWRSST